MPKLVLKKKSEVILEFILGKKDVVTIGSSKRNNIVIPDKNVSEFHCSIIKKDKKYILKDNNTLFGTKVNGKPITVHELQFGDTIELRDFSLSYQPHKLSEKKTSYISDTQKQEFQERSCYLLGIYGKFEGKKYELKEEETYIGRVDTTREGVENNIVLSGDMTCSRTHAKITYFNNQYILTDLGSTGGTAVNGEKIPQFSDVIIKPGDEITIGRNIFRFVEEGNDDYSPPKKHNIFLLKIKQPFFRILTILIIMLAAFMIFKGLNGIYIMKSKPDEIDIRFLYWKADDNVILTTLPEYDITSSPCIGDINNDGVNDIVFLNSSGLLFAWNGKTGSLLWRPIEISNSGVGSPVIADINNDFILDIICLSDKSMIYVIDGKTGYIIFRDMLSNTISTLTPAVGDLDLDGKPDIVVCAEEGVIHFIYSPGVSPTVKYIEFVEGPVYASPVILTTEEISPKVVICNNNSKIFLFEGKTREKKIIDLVEKTKKAHLIAASPGIGDLNGDEVPEIIVQSNVPQYISAIDITKFKVIWTYFVEPVPPSGIKHSASPVITDIDGDGLSDVVVCSANGKIYGLKGNTDYPSGEILWKIDIPGAGRIISSPSLYDFNKDGKMDIVCAGEDGSITIIGSSPEGETAEIIFCEKINDKPITSTIAIGDINNNGLLDLVYSDITNDIKILSTNIATFKNRIFWPMHLGGAKSTPDIPLDIQYKKDVKSHTLISVSGIGICLLTFTTGIILKKKKTNKRPKILS